jgi:hypothetical protein
LFVQFGHKIDVEKEVLFFDIERNALKMICSCNFQIIYSTWNSVQWAAIHHSLSICDENDALEGRLSLSLAAWFLAEKLSVGGQTLRIVLPTMVSLKE